MAAVNTVIRFAENTQKYGPVVIRTLAPVYSFGRSHPITVGVLAYAILVVLFINFNTLDIEAMISLEPHPTHFF